ncbi:MAG: hypothetical protein LBS01_08220, partial [Prevotellaceae bacterium]|nr:hypothetical protein [Prevotellaceae bacterium]
MNYAGTTKYRIQAVLNDLNKILKRRLANGEIVRFGDFGSFQVAIA